jgi:hypothetical protein
VKKKKAPPRTRAKESNDSTSSQASAAVKPEAVFLGGKLFIDPSDSDEMRELKHRCLVALCRASCGRVDNWFAALLAADIDLLHEVRQDEGHLWSPIERKAYIKDTVASLALALLRAAEQGMLPEIARLLDRFRGDGAPANPGQHRIIKAYINALVRENRPPIIGDLLRQLGINKPRRTQANQKEWERVNNRECVIRRTLRKFDLPLSEGKRGRRW